jgi:DNA repair protein RadA/Sms
MAKKSKTHYFCTECGNVAPVWVGRCAGCGAFNTMVEELSAPKKVSKRQIGERREQVMALKMIPEQETARFKTSINELNIVLGGGVVPSSLTLIGGEPGIGKSTLLLQLAAELGNAGKTVLYVSGEESPYQIRMRAERLGLADASVLFVAETDVDIIIDVIKREQPDMLIVDSIQTVYIDTIASAPGSVTQIRECTAQFMRLAKQLHVSIFLVGQVTKDGNIAGPKLLEHMVDTVLYFEGEQQSDYRIIRTVKNRFGSAHEIGVFLMQEDGLHEVSNPSELFVEKRERNYSGISVSAILEGTRPLLVEIQSLLSPTYFGNPQRTSSGIERNRLSLILAVLEKRAGLLLQTQDVYVKVVGGLRIDDPAADLSLAACVASASLERPIPTNVVMIGEIGLTGEIRRVSRMQERVNECVKLGYTQIIVPKNNKLKQKDAALIEVETLVETLKTLDLLKR